MPQDGHHTLNAGAWHYCSRCARKTKLDSELQWQYGKLLCDDCYDTFPVMLGDIERQQATALSFIIQNPDLRPSEKLVNPDLEHVDDDILL